MAADSGYRRQLAVTLSSLANVHSPGTVAVTVLHQDIGKRDRNRIEAGVANTLELRWVGVDPALVRDLHCPPWLPLATLFRLTLPDLLPELDRTIYLDADIVVLESLSALWRRDLGDAVLGAVRDAVSPWAAGPIGTHWRDLGLPPDAPYFNAGVLLISLSAWRKEQVVQAAADLLRAKALVYGDQDALNAVAQGCWHELPRRWNVQTMDWVGRTIGWALMRDKIESAVAEPAIIHYTTPGKPWWLGSPHPRADLWFEHLDRTAWAGWRPPTRRTIWRESGSRVKHASRTLMKGA
jgi:lipopolysaccharide biosynthesis glycosyltransferase